MAVNTRTKASIEQTMLLAKLLWKQGVKSTEVVEKLKAQSYTVKGIFYQATAVAYAIAGMESIATGLEAGKLKYSKAKGLHIA